MSQSYISDDDDEMWATHNEENDHRHNRGPTSTKTRTMWLLFSLQQFDTKLLKTQEDFNKKTIEMQDNYYKVSIQMQNNFNKKLLQIQEDFNKSIIQMQENFDKRSVQIQEDCDKKSILLDEKLDLIIKHLVPSKNKSDTSAQGITTNIVNDVQETK